MRSSSSHSRVWSFAFMKTTSPFMGGLKGLSDLFSHVIIVNAPDLLFAALPPVGDIVPLSGRVASIGLRCAMLQPCNSYCRRPVRQFSGGKRFFIHSLHGGPRSNNAVHVPGMDAVLARRETEEGTESDDLLLQQAETEERQTDGRNAEESKGRRQQAHGPSVSPQGLSPTSRTPPAEAKWGRTSALSLIDWFWIRRDGAGPHRKIRSRGGVAAKFFTTRALPDSVCPKALRHSRSERRSIECGRSSATCGRSADVSPACSRSKSSTRHAPVG